MTKFKNKIKQNETKIGTLNLTHKKKIKISALKVFNFGSFFFLE